MSVFFELRQYRIRPGRRDDWVQFMEGRIIPFQSARGMVVVGSWIGEADDDLYVWMRRFESETEREQLYSAVYDDEEWTTSIAPRIAELVDREKTIVTRLSPTGRSIIR